MYFRWAAPRRSRPSRSAPARYRGRIASWARGIFMWRRRKSCWPAKAIARNSAVIVVRSLEEAVEISNRFAPEHLSIPDRAQLGQVRHAGSVFVGRFSPEAAGDYASGPNHVLPTGGAARHRGGLS